MNRIDILIENAGLIEDFESDNDNRKLSRYHRQMKSKDIEFFKKSLSFNSFKIDDRELSAKKYKKYSKLKEKAWNQSNFFGKLHSNNLSRQKVKRQLDKYMKDEDDSLFSHKVDIWRTSEYVF